MDFVPAWIHEFFSKNDRKAPCKDCKKVIGIENLSSIGVRQGRTIDGLVIFVTLECKDCDNTIVYELKEWSLLDLALDVVAEMEDLGKNMFNEEDFKLIDEEELDDFHNEYYELKYSEKSSIINKLPLPKPETKITDKEAKADIDMIKDKNFTHHDFMSELGTSPEDLEDKK